MTALTRDLVKGSVRMSCGPVPCLLVTRGASQLTASCSANALPLVSLMHSISSLQATSRSSAERARSRMACSLAFRPAAKNPDRKHVCGSMGRQLPCFDCYGLPHQQLHRRTPSRGQAGLDPADTRRPLAGCICSHRATGLLVVASSRWAAGDGQHPRRQARVMVDPHPSPHHPSRRSHRRGSRRR